MDTFSHFLGFLETSVHSHSLCPVTQKVFNPGINLLSYSIAKYLFGGRLNGVFYQVLCNPDILSQ